MSAHARYAAHTARACGFSFRSLDRADGYLFEVRDGARRGLFAGGAGTPYALNDARAAAIARDKAFCAQALAAAGVPVLPGRMFFATERWAEMRAPGREPEDALAFAAGAEYPLFCKPLAASNGRFAEVICDAAAFADYLARVGREHFAFLAQPFVRGVEYRVFMLDGVALFSYRKRLPQLVGDGRSTVAELAARLPRDGDGAPLRARGRDGALAASGARPALGEVLVLEGPANRAAGGESADLRDGAPSALEALGAAAAAALPLRLAAVDVFDLSAAGDLSQLSVIEVNSNPMIATLEDHGRWDLIEAVWRANFAAALR
ncbi:MAG: hypothetical protein JNK94_01140 [Hyphomonadaceae bacterium]|nr:hypothetical protein [Hyphomonadaceae bacterium]